MSNFERVIARNQMANRPQRWRTRIENWTGSFRVVFRELGPATHNTGGKWWRMRAERARLKRIGYRALGRGPR